MKNKSIWVLIGVIALVFALWEGWEIYHSLQHWQPGHSAASSPLSSQSAPIAASPDAAALLRELTLPDLQQRPQSLRQWKGRVLVINFWATWCEPCKEEIPMLNQLQQTLGERQVRFVGIGVDEPSAILDYTQRQPFHYPVLTGTDQALALTRSLGNPQQGIPFTLVFDAQGHTVLEKLGRMQESELRQAIAAAGAGG